MADVFRQSETVDGFRPTAACCDISPCPLLRKKPKQPARHHHVTPEFAQGHVQRARPKWHPEPAGHSANGVAHHGQPRQQAGFGAEGFQPFQGALVCAGMAPAVHRLVRAPAHPPAQHAAQGVAGGSHHDGGPKQFGVEFDQAKHGGLGAHGQQGGRDERHDEHGAQAVLWQGQPLQQLSEPDFHLTQCSGMGHAASDGAQAWPQRLAQFPFGC